MLHRCVCSVNMLSKEHRTYGQKDTNLGRCSCIITLPIQMPGPTDPLKNEFISLKLKPTTTHWCKQRIVFVPDMHPVFPSWTTPPSWRDWFWSTLTHVLKAGLTGQLQRLVLKHHHEPEKKFQRAAKVLLLKRPLLVVKDLITLSALMRFCPMLLTKKKTSIISIQDAICCWCSFTAGLMFCRRITNWSSWVKQWTYIIPTVK